MPMLPAVPPSPGKSVAAAVGVVVVVAAAAAAVACSVAAVVRMERETTGGWQSDWTHD